MSNPKPSIELDLEAAKQLLEYVASKPLREVIHHFNNLSVAIRACESGGRQRSIEEAKFEALREHEELKRAAAVENAKDYANPEVGEEMVAQ